MGDPVFSGPWAPLFEGYAAFRRGLGFKVSASDAYVLSSFCSYLSEHVPSAKRLARADVEGYLSLFAGKAASTIRGRECMTRRFATYLRTKGREAWVLPEPLITRPSQDFVPHVFTTDEMRRIFAACDEVVTHGPGSRNRLFYQVLFRLLYSTGMRVGEALGLGVDDVDVTAGIATVHHGKGDVSRVIPFHETLSPWLERWVTERRRESDEHFFESCRGGPVRESGVGVRFKKVLLPRAGIPAGAARRVTVHSLRHTFACHSLDAAARSGVDMQAYLPLLATYMGHRDIRSTELYLRLTEERFADVTTACHGVYEGILGGPHA